LIISNEHYYLVHPDFIVVEDETGDASSSGNSVRIQLQNIPLFAGLSEAQISQITKMAVLRREPRNKVIFVVGAPAHALYVIVKGSVKVLNRDADGHEYILAMLGEDECFGEMGLIDGSLRSADVVTVETCILLEIPRVDFIRALSENVELCMNTMKSLVLRLREANQKIEDLSVLDVYGRVKKLLQEFSENENGARVMKRRITQVDMAKMVGASREMVGIVMRDLERRGIICIEKDQLTLNRRQRTEDRRQRTEDRRQNRGQKTEDRRQ
jgi:CRP/FNR family cyclic AMP-dependent transcriptional regulator